MAYEHKEGQGSLFVNEKKNDRQPDFRGSIMIKGVMYEIVGWKKTSKSGVTYMSLQASELNKETKVKEAAPGQRGEKRPLPPAPPADDRSIGDLPEDVFPF